MNNETRKLCNIQSFGFATDFPLRNSQLLGTLGKGGSLPVTTVMTFLPYLTVLQYTWFRLRCHHA